MKFPVLPILAASCFAGFPVPVRAGDLEMERSVIASGDGEWDLTQARTAFVPGDSPLFLTTLSRTAKQGAHGYHDVYLCVSRDFGRSWSSPERIPSLERSRRKDGTEVACGDLWPGWHAATGRVLITGKIFQFENGTRENTLLEKTLYASLDPESLSCGPLRILDLPETDHEGRPFLAPNAGCHQRVDLENGEVLLPIRYQKSAEKRNYTSIVAHCRFDGETLTYLEHGTEHGIPTKRGLYEPSLCRFGNRYFLTLRADDGAWVTSGEDGTRYRDPVPWTFDDGAPLGSYNTQQHWADIGGKLYLVYTRKGADNDHIMRHRAPLFIAEVDPDALHVIRATEQIVVPEDHATLGNSGVCRISENETWVTVAEGRVSYGDRSGDPNRVILARVRAAE